MDKISLKKILFSVLIVMAVVKVVLTVILFYCLCITQRYWYFLISWFVNWAVLASISWWIARKITRDFICKTILPRVQPPGKAVLITGRIIGAMIS